MDNLEITLKGLAAFGQPKLSLMDRGWHCWIKMHVAAAGATFEIASDFGHASPCEAADVCMARVRKVVGDITTATATATAINPISASLTHG